MEYIQTLPTQPSEIIDLENPPHQLSSVKHTPNSIELYIREFAYPDVSTTDQLDEEKHLQCLICWDPELSEGMITLKTCHHTFCWACFTEYLKTVINSFKVLNAACPSADCNCILAESSIRLVLDDNTYKKYQDAVLKKVISQNTETKFCPKPGCTLELRPSKKSLYTVWRVQDKGL